MAAKRRFEMLEAATAANEEISFEALQVLKTFAWLLTEKQNTKLNNMGKATVARTASAVVGQHSRPSKKMSIGANVSAREVVAQLFAGSGN